MNHTAALHQVLGEAEVEHFLQHGHVVLPGCFSREAAQELIDDAYSQLGYDSQDASTWQKPMAFLYPSRPMPIREFSPKLWGAICQLIGGEDRAAEPQGSMGQFVINFRRGQGEPWQAPSPQLQGWHKDGRFFRHFLDSNEQGLLAVPLLSDVAHKGGATALATDSVPVVSRFLLGHPEGVPYQGFDFQDMVTQCHQFSEFTGSVGDVALIHPFMLHSSTHNHSGKPRFITNINIKLREPMQFNRADAREYSPVEQCILRGLGVEHLDFHITSPRDREH